MASGAVRAANLDSLFATLERDVPGMKADMDSFFREYEARSFEIFAIEDSEAVQARLQDILDAAGIR